MKELVNLAEVEKIIGYNFKTKIQLRFYFRHLLQNLQEKFSNEKNK